MALNTTTLSAAAASSDGTVTVASTTGISAPVYPVGPYSILIVEQEVMFVTAVNTVSGVLNVNRGWAGSKAVAHNSSAPVFAVLTSDPYGGLNVVQATSGPISPSVGAPATGATITPAIWGPGTQFHFTGTTALVTINLPTNVLATEVTIVFDGSSTGLTWTAAGNIAVAGTATTAKSSVTFRYDVSTSKWIPSRLA